MNFKFLFPTFRNRYLFIRNRLQQYVPLTAGQSIRGLNLGTGEGDYDRMVAAHCQELIGCDVNEEDLAHAQRLNTDVSNLRYEVNNALDLSYPDQSFDLIVTCEVIEHVGEPEQMVREMARVLKPGGYALMTFPSREFPVTYDPINRIYQTLFRKSGQKEWAISQGAYAFGHDYLIGSKDFRSWAEKAGFEIVEFQGLSRYLVGLLEVYWTGIAQSIFKKNARNVTTDTSGGVKIRPASTKEPFLVFFTDALLAIDHMLFAWGSASVGKGVVLRRK
ncbi:MAG TPA: methyltransferase domain-containing protein [Saprospiraceae bacterium]|nr:methyltransferase domain-containing protein [Saprospiraceae bacterium]